MIKINERFQIERRPNEWTLIEKSMKFNVKTGKPAENFRQSYYPNLEQALNEVIERSADDKETTQSLSEVLDRFNDAKAEILTALSAVENNGEIMSKKFKLETSGVKSEVA